VSEQRGIDVNAALVVVAAFGVIILGNVSGLFRSCSQPFSEPASCCKPAGYDRHGLTGCECTRPRVAMPLPAAATEVQP